MWEGDISGRIIELVPDKKVVQEWYFGDSVEQSIVTINISPSGGESVIVVEHTNIPDDDFENIVEGWNEYYMGAIRRFYNPNF
jgi:activator of HSP90 ATPase